MSFLPELNKMFRRAFLNLLPATPMGWAMLIGLAVWFINWTLADNETSTLLGSVWLKRIIDLASGLALIPLAYHLFRATRWILRELLWRLRQRLIVTYFLIGVLPLTLLSLLVGLIGYAVFVESSSTIVARQLDGFIAQSHAAAHALDSDLSGELSRVNATELQRALQERVEDLAAVFPGLRIVAWRGGEANLRIAVTPQASATALGTALSSPQVPLPAWMNARQEFHGLIVEQRRDGRHQLAVRHVIRDNGPTPAFIDLSYPVSQEIGQQISRTTGVTVENLPGLIAFERVAAAPEVGLDVARPEQEDQHLTVNVSAVRPGAVVINEPGSEEAGYPVMLSATEWETGRPLDVIAVAVDWNSLSLAEIRRRFTAFQSGNMFSGAIVIVISGLALFFLAIATTAVISAAFLTRSITGAIHALYQGTKRVEAGDLSHEIPIRGNDQLGELSRSFNQMTRSIRELLRVSAEKQKLDQEMKIAAEVQSRLFPRTVPKTESLDIAPGICIPARAVSGDYYDFLDIAPGLIGVVVADVCGKGMSAALLMSNLQASLRGQAQAYRDLYQQSRAALIAEVSETAKAAEQSLPSPQRVRRIVANVNRQIESSTADARYVTMFYAEIDERAGLLRYTNAGHNAPLLLRHNQGGATSIIERLETGGTVLGLFSEAEYEEAELKLDSGDLLVACTDGAIEAHNPQGEEFGEDRLAELLLESAHLTALEIERLILKAVKDWTGGTDQEDDLTLVVIRRK